LNRTLPILLVLLSCVHTGALLQARLKPVITAPQGVRGTSVAVRVVFEKDGRPTPVNGFSASDVSLVHGKLSGFTERGGAYEFKVTPETDLFTVSIAAGAADNRFAVFSKADAGTPFYTWKHQMEIHIQV